MRSGPLSSRRYFPKRTSTQRFDEAPKLDGGLGSGKVAVIAIPLAFRRAAACAVEATNGPAVQKVTWYHHAEKSFSKNRNDHRSSEIFPGTERRISAGVGKIDANNWFLSMTWGKGTDHLPISCQEGGKRGRSIGAQVEVWSAFQISARRP